LFPEKLQENLHFKKGKIPGSRKQNCPGHVGKNRGDRSTRTTGKTVGCKFKRQDKKATLQKPKSSGKIIHKKRKKKIC